MIDDSAASSWVRFRKGQESAPISSLTNIIRIHAVSDGPSWLGLHLEIGDATGWQGEDIMVDGHFVSMNLTPDVLHFETRAEDDATWQPAVRLPGAFWIHPEGSPLSHRVMQSTPWAAAIIDGKFLDAVMGQHYELRGGVSVVDDLLQHLFRSLTEALVDPTPPNATLLESLVRAFVLALGTRHGHPAPEMQGKSGLGSEQMRRLLAWIDHHLETRITVKAMAAQVDLSVAHFSREFKRATGLTPWEHIIEARLQRARQLLARGEAVCATAQECGFFDQAHLSRLFKQRFGVSPSAFAKGHVLPT